MLTASRYGAAPVSIAWRSTSAVSPDPKTCPHRQITTSRGVPYLCSAHATTHPNTATYATSPAPLPATHSALSASTLTGSLCSPARFVLCSVVSRSISRGGAVRCTTVDAVKIAM